MSQEMRLWGFLIAKGIPAVLTIIAFFYFWPPWAWHFIGMMAFVPVVLFIFFVLPDWLEKRRERQFLRDMQARKKDKGV